MKKALFNWLGFYDVPPEQWKCMHTTNILERAFREKRRRTRPMKNFFTNEASSNRTMCGISQMLIKSWRGKPFNQICAI